MLTNGQIHIELIELEEKKDKTDWDNNRITFLKLMKKRNDDDEADAKAKPQKSMVSYAAIMESIRKLSLVEREKVTAYLSGQAKIIYKSELQAIEDAKHWYLRVHSTFRERIEALLDDKKITGRVLLDAFKEISSRVIAPKQEIIFKDSIRDKSDTDLVGEVDKLIVVIDKNKKTETAEMVKTGRPATKRF